MMERWIRAALARYGQTVRLETAEGGGQVQAFLQPLAEKSERAPSAVAAVGWLDQRLWLYLGQAAVAPGDRIVWEGRYFRVRSGRPYHAGGQLLYWWALLEREREAAE